MKRARTSDRQKSRESGKRGKREEKKDFKKTTKKDSKSFNAKSSSSSSLIKNKSSISSSSSKIVKESKPSTKSFTPKLESMTMEEKREFYAKKKASKPLFPIFQKLRSLHQQCNTDNDENNDQNRIINEMLETIGDHSVELSENPVISRIIQWILKVGTDSHRDILYSKFKSNTMEKSKLKEKKEKKESISSNDLLRLSRGKHGHFVMLKLLKYHSNARRDIVQEFSGCFIKAMRSRTSRKIVEFIWNELANFKGHNRILISFYGLDKILPPSDLELTLEEILVKYPLKRETILKNLEDHILYLVKQDHIESPLFHRILSDFLSHSNPGNIQKILEEDLIPTIPLINHTVDGSYCSILIFAHSNTKERKKIIKLIKEFILKMIYDERSSNFIIGILHLIDDTVIAGKALLEPLKDQISFLIDDRIGRKILNYLTSGLNKKYISPLTINQIETAFNLSQFSKKEGNIRRKELGDYLIEDLKKISIERRDQQLLIDLIARDGLEFLEEIIKNIAFSCEEEGQDENGNGENDEMEMKSDFELYKNLAKKASSNEIIANRLYSLAKNNGKGEDGNEGANDSIQRLALGQGAYFLMYLAKNNEAIRADLKSMNLQGDSKSLEILKKHL